MAYAALSRQHEVLGYFVEKSHGHTFEYVENPDKPMHIDMATGRLTVYPHLVFVGPLGETRRALVRKSVAYVVIDEYWRQGEQHWVVERWHLKKHKEFA